MTEAEKTIGYEKGQTVTAAVTDVTNESAELGVFEGFQITTAEQADEAGRALQSVGRLLKSAVEKRLGITRPIDATKKAVMALFKPGMEQLESIQDHLRSELGRWDTIQKDRAAAARRAQEQIRREEQAAQERREKEKRDRLIADSKKAIDAMDGGNIAELEQLQEDQENPMPPAGDLLAPPAEPLVPAPVAQAASFVPRKVMGVSMKTVWKFEVTNPAEVPREYMKIDETLLRTVATSQKATASVPGVRFYSEEVPTRGRS